MKLHVNSTISNVKSRYMYMDVRYFYLSNQMDRDKYIMIQISMIPKEFVEMYNLAEKSHNEYICSRVAKGMYGLPQAGRIAHNSLVKHLDPYGCHHSRKENDYGNTTFDQ